MPPRILEGAMCVQRFDDSLNSAIHITYRVSLRSSSMREPRDPLLKVVFNLLFVGHPKRVSKQTFLIRCLKKIWPKPGSQVFEGDFATRAKKIQ